MAKTKTGKSETSTIVSNRVTQWHTSVVNTEQIMPTVDSKSDQASESAPAYEPKLFTGPDAEQKVHQDPAAPEAIALDKCDNSSYNKAEAPSKPRNTLADEYESAVKRFICALGPQSSFFYFGGDSNISWTYYFVDSECPYTVSGASLRTWMINEPYQVALSPHGAGYFAYNSHTDGLMWRFVDISPLTRPKKRRARKQFDKILIAYSRLKEWLGINVVTTEEFKTTQIAFGPGARYLAWKPNGNHIGNDLPKSFQDELIKRKATQAKDILPQRLSFGIGEAWASIWQDGTHRVFADKGYPGLETCLTQAGSRPLFIELDCNDASSEFLVLFSGVQRHGLVTSNRAGKLGNHWNKQLLEWSRRLDMTLSASNQGDVDFGRRIITPQDAWNAKAAVSAQEAEKSRELAEEAALLTIKSAKKSITASKIAVVAGAAAIATACTVM